MKEFLTGADRVAAVLQELGEGKTRQEVADRYAYATYRGLDTFMKRQGYLWNREQQNYTQKHAIREKSQSLSAGVHLSERIIEFLATGMKPRQAAAEGGFKNTREMGIFMAEHGYTWNHQQNNYMRLTAPIIYSEVTESAAKPSAVAALSSVTPKAGKDTILINQTVAISPDDGQVQITYKTNMRWQDIPIPYQKIIWKMLHRD